MEDKSLIPLAKEKLEKDFSLEEYNASLSIEETETVDELIEMMAPKIAVLMEMDFDRFVNALYRIDVGEDKVADVFNAVNRDLLYQELAKLIVERQMQRAKTQFMYKNGMI